MKKYSLILALFSIALTSLAQITPTKPSGSKTLGNTVYLSTDSTTYFGNGEVGFYKNGIFFKDWKVGNSYLKGETVAKKINGIIGTFRSLVDENDIEPIISPWSLVSEIPLDTFNIETTYAKDVIVYVNIGVAVLIRSILDDNVGNDPSTTLGTAWDVISVHMGVYDSEMEYDLQLGTYPASVDYDGSVYKTATKVTGGLPIVWEQINEVLNFTSGLTKLNNNVVLGGDVNANTILSISEDSINTQFIIHESLAGPALSFKSLNSKTTAPYFNTRGMNWVVGTGGTNVNSGSPNEIEFSIGSGGGGFRLDNRTDGVSADIFSGRNLTFMSNYQFTGDTLYQYLNFDNNKRVLLGVNYKPGFGELNNPVHAQWMSIGNDPTNGHEINFWYKPAEGGSAGLKNLLKLGEIGIKAPLLYETSNTFDNDRQIPDLGAIKALVSDSLSNHGGSGTPTLQQVTTAGRTTNTGLDISDELIVTDNQSSGNKFSVFDQNVGDGAIRVYTNGATYPIGFSAAENRWSLASASSSIEAFSTNYSGFNTHALFFKRSTAGIATVLRPAEPTASEIRTLVLPYANDTLATVGQLQDLIDGAFVNTTTSQDDIAGIKSWSNSHQWAPPIGGDEGTGNFSQLNSSIAITTDAESISPKIVGKMGANTAFVIRTDPTSSSDNETLMELNNGNFAINSGNLKVNGGDITSSRGFFLTSVNTQSIQADALLSITAGPSNQLYVTGDGLGIGNMPSITRASPLQVQGNIWSTDAYILGTGGSPIAEFGLSGNVFIRTLGAQSLSLQTNNTERIGIASTGAVTITNNLSTTGTGAFGSNSVRMGNDGIVVTPTANTIAAATSSVIIGKTSTGSVIRGTSAASDSPTFLLTGAAAGGVQLQLLEGGVNANGVYTNTSDIRIKNLVQNFDYQSVADLKAATFTYKDNRDSRVHVGYIAQEVEEVLPNAVYESEQTGLLSVDHVQVLIAKVSLLEKKIKELELYIESNLK